MHKYRGNIVKPLSSKTHKHLKIYTKNKTKQNPLSLINFLRKLTVL